MSDSPDAIRAEIERTRESLGTDVDALADKVTPSKIVDRQKDRVRSAFVSFRDSVMGAADDAGAAASGAAEGVADAASGVKAKAQGNPLAVGLIALGAGLLVASLIPASQREKQVAEQVKDQAQPLVQKAAEVGRDVVDELQQPAQEAATAVKDRAQEAVSTVRDEATDAADTVKASAQDARDRATGE